MTDQALHPLKAAVALASSLPGHRVILPRLRVERAPMERIALIVTVRTPAVVTTAEPIFFVRNTS